jgi:hypothetical protein
MYPGTCASANSIAIFIGVYMSSVPPYEEYTVALETLRCYARRNGYRTAVDTDWARIGQHMCVILLFNLYWPIKRNLFVSQNFYFKCSLDIDMPDLCVSLGLFIVDLTNEPVVVRACSNFSDEITASVGYFRRHCALAVYMSHRILCAGNFCIFILHLILFN